MSTKIIHCARIGARLLEGAVKDNNVHQIHRAMRGVAFAVAVTRFRGSSIAALQGFNPEVRITCFAAICAVQKKPLLIAARIMVRVDDFAKASRLKPTATSRICWPLWAPKPIAGRKAFHLQTERDSQSRARLTSIIKVNEIGKTPANAKTPAIRDNATPDDSF
jgi:hypothetical protein